MRQIFSMDRIGGLMGRKTIEQQVEDAKADIQKAAEFAYTKTTPGFKHITNSFEKQRAAINRQLSNEHISDEDLRRANLKLSLLAEIESDLLLVETRGNEARVKLARIKESHNG